MKHLTGHATSNVSQPVLYSVLKFALKQHLVGFILCNLPESTKQTKQNHLAAVHAITES